MNQLLEYVGKIVADSPIRMILSKSSDASNAFRKIILTDKVDSYQAEKFTASQVFHETLQADRLGDYLYEAMSHSFLQLNSFHGAKAYSIRVSRKGKATLSESKSENLAVPNAEHNRQKNYIFPEGQVIEPLVDMGIMTREGKVLPSSYDKFKQINRFIEMVDDTIKDRVITELTVVDFGCGKSYLTFLLYYYFEFIKTIKVKMVGLDLKEEVIQKCNLVAQKYGYSGLSFQIGDIETFRVDYPIDMVITLHACDTATDHALLHAILWDARMIFSVPCCQHEFNHQIASGQFSIITRYGIIQEHVSSALTDAVRANLLLCCGYKTQLLEFIDFAHTPKNLLIRAIKANIPQAVKAKALAEVMRLTAEFHLEPTLLSLLISEGLINP